MLESITAELSLSKSPLQGDEVAKRTAFPPGNRVLNRGSQRARLSLLDTVGARRREAAGCLSPGH